MHSETQWDSRYIVVWTICTARHNEIAGTLQEPNYMWASQSRTCKLWMQYIEYVDLVKLFIIAEWMSEWYLHLNACTKMLNLFAATGHYNYAKSCCIYVQQMHALAETHHALHEKFVSSNHTICRTVMQSCDWTNTDEISERSRCTNLGHGIHTSVRYVWTNTMTECASIHLAVSNLIGLHNSIQITESCWSYSNKNQTRGNKSEEG